VSDDTLTRSLQKVARQDRPAFRQVYSLSAAKLAGVLTRMLRDRAEVEDALQDVYVRVWQRAAQFDAARGEAMGWLVAIARNVALDRLRARPESRGFSHVSPRPGADADAPDPIDRLPAQGPSADGRLMAGDQARRIVDCFDELETDRAEAVRGAYLQGLSYQDLAQRHAVPLNTMRTWLRRSLVRLKECLDR
jgi:RNA polymerase sigma-70 factor, ECF subfamily